MNMIDADRVVNLSQVHNFRDYGGYPLAGGGRLKRHWLFRSAQHSHATADDLAAIDRLGITAVIDLRGGTERDIYPNRHSDGFAAETLFESADTAGMAPHIAVAREVGGPEQARAAMAQGYREMPFRPALSRILTRYFELLERVDGPSLIHCMAGKDRTGIAVALFHDMVGVHRDDLLSDYLLTNTAGRPADRVAAGAETMRTGFGMVMEDDVVREIMMVHPSYIEAAFAAMEERHGSIAAYLRDWLGVTDARREAILERAVA